MKFNSLIPELSVSNYHKSKEFYESIGFSVVYERVEDSFCFLQLEDNQIMIQENNHVWDTGELDYPYGRGINISMSVSDIDSYYSALKKNNVSFFLELEIHSYRVDDTIYDDKEFLIQDPDGYLLRFNN